MLPLCNLQCKTSCCRGHSGTWVCFFFFFQSLSSVGCHCLNLPPAHSLHMLTVEVESQSWSWEWDDLCSCCCHLLQGVFHTHCVMLCWWLGKHTADSCTKNYFSGQSPAFQFTGARLYLLLRQIFQPNNLYFIVEKRRNLVKNTLCSWLMFLC